MREIMAIDKKAKVVMVGAVGQEQMIKKEMELGAEDFIVNLFNTSNVEERVKKMLKWNFLEGFF